MGERDFLTRRFEENRSHIRAVAYRMLGSEGEADDAVQDAWLRLYGSDASPIENLAAWLTSVVARVRLNMLRKRKPRREEPLAVDLAQAVELNSAETDPEHEATLADSIGPALLAVLDWLGPAERLAFVLHDMFAVPFEEIATILGRSPAAARQLASRARRHIQGAETGSDLDRARQRKVVEAFLIASREGDFEALLSRLGPDVMLRSDRAALDLGARAEARGPAAEAENFKGRARGARLALIYGRIGAV